MKKKQYGILYIISTPIGNLKDITLRAIHYLKKVDIIAAENTKHTKNLLKHLKIDTKTTSFHQNNETQKIEKIINILKKNKNIGLVSNAGTPTINDPGYKLVKICHKENILVVPIPGPCAAIAAISASGISTNKFCYEGFLPRKKSERITFLKKLLLEERTIILYESCHRILDSMKNISLIFEKTRKIVLAKEITKQWETIKSGTPIEILFWLQEDKYRQKGEITIIIEGKKKKNKDQYSPKILKTFLILSNEVSIKTSVKLTAKIHKINKNKLYQFILKQKNKNDKRQKI